MSWARVQALSTEIDEMRSQIKTLRMIRHTLTEWLGGFLFAAAVLYVAWVTILAEFLCRAAPYGCPKI